MSQPLPPAILESHGVTVSLSGTPDLDAFVSAANAKVRIKGLDDLLNPGIIDAAKLRAMVASLPAQPEPVRTALSGHSLIVGAAGFGVLAAEPTRADAFGPSYRITVERLAGVHVVASANPAMDKELARSRTAAARAATEAAVAAVTASEAGRPNPDGLEIGALRRRRASASYGWLIAATAWKNSDAGNGDAAVAYEAARKAASAYDMPSGGLI